MVAEPLNIDLSWDIVIGFEIWRRKLKRMWWLGSKYHHNVGPLFTTNFFVFFFPFILMLFICLCVSCSSLSHISPFFSLAISLSQFYHYFLHALSFFSSIFMPRSLSIILLPSLLSLSYPLLLSSSFGFVLILPSIIYFHHVYFQMPYAFLHSALFPCHTFSWILLANKPFLG